MAEPDNLMSQVAQRVADRAQGMAQQIAKTIGQPVDATNLSRAEQVKLWNMPNPQADPMQIQQLLAAGQHSKAVDLAYPWRNKMIGMGSPQDRVNRANQFAKMAMEGVSS